MNASRPRLVEFGQTVIADTLGSLIAAGLIALGASLYGLIELSTAQVLSLLGAVVGLIAAALALARNVQEARRAELEALERFDERIAEILEQFDERIAEIVAGRRNMGVMHDEGDEPGKKQK